MSKDYGEATKPIGEAVEETFKLIAQYIEQARRNVVRSINAEQVIAYWYIGQTIVQQEQRGEKRAGYGKLLLQNLSKRLNEAFGKGFSISTLKYIRQFYLAYANRIGHEPRDQFNQQGFD